MWNNQPKDRLFKNTFNPTHYGPFGATPDIGVGHNVPHTISYACSICAILMGIHMWNHQPKDTTFSSLNIGHDFTEVDSGYA